MADGNPGRWLCIHLKQLALDAVLRSMPPEELAHQHDLIVVVDQRGSQRWICGFPATLSETGIHQGQALAAAYALLPQLRALPRQLPAERQSLLQVASWACQLSSRVCLQAPDMVLLELSGSLRLLGEDWRQAIKQGVRETGFAAGLAQGMPPVEAIRFATATASISVTRPGTAPSMPARTEIEDMLRQNPG